MPTEQELFSKLSTMIETKINKRNKEAINLPRNAALIDYFDKEIDTLQEIENYIYSVLSIYNSKLLREKKKSFELGRKAGIMEAKTGRSHTQYFI